MGREDERKLTEDIIKSTRDTTEELRFITYSGDISVFPLDFGSSIPLSQNDSSDVLVILSPHGVNLSKNIAVVNTEYFKADTQLKNIISVFWAILGTVALIALVLYATGIYLGLGVGGMERILVYPDILWALGFGGWIVAKYGEK